MLGQRRKRWPNIKPTLVQYLMGTIDLLSEVNTVQCHLTLQSQKAVSDFLKSKQILPFSFARYIVNFNHGVPLIRVLPKKLVGVMATKRSIFIPQICFCNWINQFFMLLEYLECWPPGVCRDLLSTLIKLPKFGRVDDINHGNGLRTKLNSNAVQY